MNEELLGRRAELRRTVTDRDTAAAFGNPGVDVLGTPALVGWVEDAALAALAPFLGEDEHSVGTHVEIWHEAPTPVGEEVVLEATVESVEGREVRFAVVARAGERIASARHSRFVVDSERFFRRAAGKPGSA